MAKNTKTPVMVLNELCVKSKFAPPSFDLIYSVTGTHENRFDYKVSAASVEAIGTGSSKQIAKQDAAHKALMELKEQGIYNSADNPVEPFNAVLRKYMEDSSSSKAVDDFSGSLNCVGPLLDMCIEHKIPTPVFELIGEQGPPHCKEFTFQCTVSSVSTVAKSTTKKVAKQLTAQEMMGKIKNILPEVDPTALKTYNELYSNVIPDKTVNVADFPYTLKKLMEQNEKSIEDFEEELKDPTEESLKALLAKLGLDHSIHVLQGNPYAIAIIVNIDTPLTSLGVGASVNSALNNALEHVFQVLNCYLKL